MARFCAVNENNHYHEPHIFSTVNTFLSELYLKHVISLLDIYVSKSRIQSCFNKSKLKTRIFDIEGLINEAQTLARAKPCDLYLINLKRFYI